MNKIYSLLGIGLLSAATLSSCKEDVFIEGGDELQRGESQTYVAVASRHSCISPWQYNHVIQRS